jgi:hypothetical protein
VRGIEELLKHALGLGIELTCRFPHTLPQALADSHQLELAILTLALDTRDSMPEGGRLTISASARDHAADDTAPPLQAGSYVRIKMVSTVVDGVGRAKATAALLSTEDRGGHSPLSAMRMMTDQYGGALRIERRADGETVELWLPQDITSRATHPIGGARLGPLPATREDGRI